jgi:predicted RNA-binding Zn ribbon-like protein
MKLEPISAYGSFMPDIAATGRWSQLPSPRTERFWRLYAEPLDQFLDLAAHLRRAIDQASNLTSPQDLHRGIDTLGILTAPVRTMLYQDDQRQLAVGWACHSLLASYAMMATLDLAQTRLIRCEKPDCGVYFISKSRKARYCSPSCRSIVQMRKSRLKRKQEESGIVR